MVIGTNSSRGLDIENLFIEDWVTLLVGGDFASSLVGDHLLSSLAASDYPSHLFNGQNWGEAAFANPLASCSRPTNDIKHYVPCTLNVSSNKYYYKCILHVAARWFS